MPATEQRVMRISIPVSLIREMDAVILGGVGGYSTRAEFIVDAIQERILELTAEGTEDAGAPPRPDESPEHAQAIEPVVRQIASAADAVNTAMTVLSAPTVGYVVNAADDLSRPESRSLFGLHNRDYPSLWALTKLAALTRDEPIPIGTYTREVLSEAWSFGELLLSIEKHTGVKCTALFPTNSEKRKPAETGFRAFAIGDYRIDADVYSTSGPLFEWRVMGIINGGSDEPYVGVTEAGWKLLEAVSGVSVDGPHPHAAGRAFFEHLSGNAPADRRGFHEIVRAIGTGGATRQDVLEHVAEAWPAWTENEVSTNSAGYIARAREWGLVEPKQIKTRYHLTPLGHEHVIGEDG